LHSQLARVDPEAAARIAPRDGQRIQRALEVERLTGTPLSRLQREDLKRRSDAAYLKLVLAPTRRETLDERLAGRFDRMLAAGLLEEIRALHARGDLSPDLPALRAVGYRQLWPVVSCGEDLGMARAAAIQATRQLAKRQYTWLRAEPDAKWLEPGADGGVAALRQVIGATLTAG